MPQGIAATSVPRNLMQTRRGPFSSAVNERSCTQYYIGKGLRHGAARLCQTEIDMVIILWQRQRKDGYGEVTKSPFRHLSTHSA